MVIFWDRYLYTVSISFKLKMYLFDTIIQFTIFSPKDLTGYWYSYIHYIGYILKYPHFKEYDFIKKK